MILYVATGIIYNVKTLLKDNSSANHGFNITIMSDIKSRTHAAHRSAGPHTGHEYIDLPVRILPDFLSGNAPTIKEAVSPAISCIGSVLMSQMNNPRK